MNKTNYQKALVTEFGYTAAQAERIADFTFDVHIPNQLAEHGEFGVRNFGSFKVAIKKARKGSVKHPTTGVVYEYDKPAKNVVRFNPSDNLDEAVADFVVTK